MSKEHKCLRPLLEATIRALLAKHEGNVTKAAELFNGTEGPPCPRSTMYRWIKMFGIDAGQYRRKGEDNG